MASLNDIEKLAQQILQEIRDMDKPRPVSAKDVVVVNGLSDIDDSLGVIRAGEFRSGINEPGSGFTGVRIGYPGFVYNGDTWNVVGVNNDVMQFGIRAADGVAVFGGGNGYLTNQGLVLIQGTGEEQALKWRKDTLTGSNTAHIINWLTTNYDGNGNDSSAILVIGGGDNEVNVPVVQDGRAGLKAVAEDGAGGIISTQLAVYRTKPGVGGNEGDYRVLELSIDGTRDIIRVDKDATQYSIVVTGGNVKFFGGGPTDTGGGAGVIHINDATTVPTSNPTQGGILYVENGALKYRGPAGTITTIAPA